jgi:ATP adenylyltransferase
MERLWTPWRMAYISGTSEAEQERQSGEGGEGGSEGGGGAPGCFLCTHGGDTRDEAHFVLHRAAHGYVLLNLYPYNSGHILVAPYIHEGDLTRLSPEVGHQLFDLTQQAVAALRLEYKPDGFNVGLNLGRSAGAGLPDHLHVHVVPRWNGDTNYMPVVGQTKVLPEALDQTWRRLRRHFG